MSEIKNPQPGDVVNLQLPEQGLRQGLILRWQDGIIENIPAAIVTLVQTTPPSVSTQQSFMMRMREELFPLDRKGNDTINPKHILVAPVTRHVFPELDGEPKLSSDVRLPVLKSIQPDWLRIIRNKMPHNAFWDRKLLNPASFSEEFRRVAQEVEDQFATARHPFSILPDDDNNGDPSPS